LCDNSKKRETTIGCKLNNAHNFNVKSFGFLFVISSRFGGKIVGKICDAVVPTPIRGDLTWSIGLLEVLDY